MILWNKVLGIIADELIHDHEMRTSKNRARGIEFQQVLYHRMFSMLFSKLCAPEPVLGEIQYGLLKAYTMKYYINYVQVEHLVFVMLGLN